MEQNMLQEIFELNDKGFSFTFFVDIGGFNVLYFPQTSSKLDMKVYRIYNSSSRNEQEVRYAIDACYLFLESLELDAV